MLHECAWEYPALERDGLASSSVLCLSGPLEGLPRPLYLSPAQGQGRMGLSNLLGAEIKCQSGLRRSGQFCHPFQCPLFPQPTVAKRAAEHLPLLGIVCTLVPGVECGVSGARLNLINLFAPRRGP